MLEFIIIELIIGYVILRILSAMHMSIAKKRMDFKEVEIGHAFKWNLLAFIPFLNIIAVLQALISHVTYRIQISKGWPT